MREKEEKAMVEKKIINSYNIKNRQKLRNGFDGNTMHF